MSTPTKFSPEFKAAAIARLNAGESVRALAKKLGVNPTSLWRWKQEAAESPAGTGAYGVVLPPPPQTPTLAEMLSPIAVTEVPTTEFDNQLLAEDNNRLNKEVAALSHLVQLLLARRGA